MRKAIFTLAATALLVAAAFGPATADVERHQIVTNEYTITVNGTYDYDFEFELACGVVTGTGSVLSYTETVEGTVELVDVDLVKGTISFKSTYDTGYWWTGTFDTYGGAVSNITTSLGQTGLTAAATLDASDRTEYKNHGQYVKDMGGGADAARSCIGMPVQTQY